MLLHNQFTKVAIKVSGAGVRNASELKKAFLHVHESEVYLLSHIQTINENVDGVPMHGMRCVTALGSTARFNEFTDVTSFYAHGVRGVFFHDAESIAAVHGRTSRRQPSTAAPASAPLASETSAINGGNPYVLPNYTREMYSGFHCYHSSHNVTMNTPTNGCRGYRIGVELETEFDTESARASFTSIPRNWYFCEHDGSLNRGGCEIITIPLTPFDAKSRTTWKPLCNKLKSLGATSWDNGRCGLHVHIGREILGDTTEEREAILSRLLLFYNLYLNDDETATKVFGRARCYNEGRHENTQEFAAVKCLGTAVLKDKEIAKRVGDAVKAKQNANRYYAINTTNRATIEFRKGRGSINADRIQSIITFCEAVCLYVRSSDDVAALTVEGFREFIRANVPASNALYHYYDVIEADC